ncbi:VOC family protein [Rhodobacteraceae bacterium R_SAG3]|uniref:VOC family protein n=1 Tax=Tritonibacter mobilis TaxID=379347 RepID=UPI0014484F98|nr:VOC family protein [Tritonibacter mobilis]MCA2008952.1 VOC family protein [Tritonibacter mobilis]NKX75372.1 VOC family protein [Rhodobacteraceae bacterium R_SAG3]
MELDHFAIAANTLAEATAHVEEALGVPLQPGGEHAVFGTHNRLLGLADGLYLEAIAIDPEATPQRQPRWFDLDRFEGAARITNWICRSSDLDSTLAALPVDAGAPVSLTRGDLSWQMAVPKSGILPYDNIFPALIQWQGPHPAPRLTQQGCSLRRLVVSHPEAQALAELLPLGDARVVFEPGPAALRAEIDTPHGLRHLS